MEDSDRFTHNSDKSFRSFGNESFLFTFPFPNETKITDCGQEWNHSQNTHKMLTYEPH